MVRLPNFYEIFKKDSNDKLVWRNAPLSQYILRNPLLVKLEKSGYSTPFRHWDLAKLIVEKFPEFRDYYQIHPRNHTSPSNRIENTRKRTLDLIKVLISLGLLKPAGKVPQRRGSGVTESYKSTFAAYFVVYIIECIDTKYSQEAIQKLLELLNLFTDIKTSYITDFITKFFNRCNDAQTLDIIIDYFIQVILPVSEIKNGIDLLKLFFGLSNPLNWMLANPEIFLETLAEIKGEQKKALIFQFKMEIEDYYDKHFLDEESLAITELNTDYAKTHNIIETEPNYFDFISVPEKNWQNTRIDNIADYTRVVVPSPCAVCKSNQAFLVNILKYLECFRYAHRADFSRYIGGNCIRCGNYLVGNLMRFTYFNMTAPWIGSSFSRDLLRKRLKLDFGQSIFIYYLVL